MYTLLERVCSELMEAAELTYTISILIDLYKEHAKDLTTQSDSTLTKKTTVFSLVSHVFPMQ